MLLSSRLLLNTPRKTYTPVLLKRRPLFLATAPDDIVVSCSEHSRISDVANRAIALNFKTRQAAFEELRVALTNKDNVITASAQVNFEL